MILTEILGIIRLTLEVALEISRGMPQEQKAEFWKRHDERMEFWHKLMTKHEKD